MMEQVTPTTLVEIIKSHVVTDDPCLIWGSPGLGKSAIVAQTATEVGAHVVDVRLSLYESVDLRGLMNLEAPPEGGKTLTCWYPPAALPFEGNDAFPDDVPIIIFLDELLHAVPSVLAVAFQLVLDRRIGEHRLKSNVRIIAASNRSGDKSGVGRLPAALANRFSHYELTPCVDAWRDWVVDTHPEGGEIVAGFLAKKPDLLDQFAAACSSGDKAFPTPRSWSVVARLCETMRGSSVFDRRVAAAIGGAAAAEFLAFMKNRERLIAFAEIVADPEGARVPPEGDVDVLYSLSSMLVARCDKATVQAVATYTQRLPLEYQVLIVRDMYRVKPRVALGSKDFAAMQRHLDSAVYGS